MSRKNDIEALINRAEVKLPEIMKEYDNSLHDKTVKSALKIEIKDYFGNLRSALDYLAHEIVEKYCPNANPKDQLYFPIRNDQSAFDGIMNKSYPDLKTNSSIVYDILEKIQPFQGGSNAWLSSFNKINNEHKHDKLTPQKRTETKRINVDIGSGGSVNWDPSAVTFGAGVFIGGVPVNPRTQMPVPSSSQTVTIETWVDFQFEDIEVSAIGLIRETLQKIKGLYEDIKNEI